MGDYNVFSMLKQTVLGAANEALLGFPKWLIDRDATGLYKPEDTKQERFARGVGSFVGFFGGPAAVYKKGASMALKAGGKAVLGKGLKKAVTRGALSGAGGFAAYETLKAPEEGQDFGDKLTSVPLAIAMGGALGIASPLLKPVFKKHSEKLYNNIIKKGTKEEYKSIMDRIAVDSTKIVENADKGFMRLLNSNQFGAARKFGREVYAGTKKLASEARVKTANLKFVKNKKGIARKLADADYIEKIKLVTEDSYVDKNIVKEIYEGAKKNLSNARQAIYSGTEYLNRQGPSGIAFSKTANALRKTGEAAAGESVVQYGRSVQDNTLKSLSKYAAVAEGRLFPTKELMRPMQYWNGARTSILNNYNTMANSGRFPGMKPIRQVKNYFPHYTINPSSSKEVINETLKAALERGEIKSIQEGRVALNQYFDAFKTGKIENNSKLIDVLMNKNASIKTRAEAKSSLLGTISREKDPGFTLLEGHRDINVPFWDPNPNRVIPRYISSATTRLEEIKAIGHDYQKLWALTEPMKKEGKDWEYAQRAIKRMKGEGARDLVFGISPEAQGKIREFQVITKLGLASIPNATQSTNTALVTGTRNTAKQIANYFSGAKSKKEMAEWALRIGATLESSLNQFYTGTGVAGSAAQKFLKATKFIQIERFNRIVAANSGKKYAEDMAIRLLKNNKDRFANRAFKKLNVSAKDIIKRGYINEAETISIAQDIVNKTQFRAGPLDLPLWFSSPHGRLVTQFKSFAFNQAKLMKDLWKEEVMNGNLRPLIRAVTLMPILGEGVKDVRSILTGQVRDEKGLDRLLDNVSSVGGIGMVNDLYQAARYNSMAGYMAGPTVSDIGKATTGVVKSTQGKPRQLERWLLRQAPVVGPFMANALTPSLRLKRKRKKQLKQRSK